MTLVKTNTEIQYIRGRMGGIYFKRGNPGQHIQAMPRHVRYARLGTQAGQTTTFTSGAGYWALALLVYFAASWAAYALVYYFTTKTGEKKRISGYCCNKAGYEKNPKTQHISSIGST